MDFARIISRIKGILIEPQYEWPRAAAEPDTVPRLYTGYILIVAALPVLARFIKQSLIGYDMLGTTLRIPIGMGIAALLLGYVSSLIVTYIVALVINALAPNFGGQKSMVQALKTTAYAWTASWVLTVAVIVPWIGGIVSLIGAIYAFYLLYLGLPQTMKCPPDRAGGYTAVSAIVGIVLSISVSFLVSHITGVAALSRGYAAGYLAGAHYDRDTNAPAVSGSSAAQFANIAPNAKIQSLSADQIKSFLPDTLAGFKRDSVSAEHNTSGMQASSATANYTDDSGHSITIDVMDSGGMRGLMSMAGSMAPDSDHETDHGYAKTYTQNGRLIDEKWDSSNKVGEFSEIVGGRFNVKASGHVDSMDQLKQAVAAIDLDKLAALKNQGIGAN